MTKEELMEMFAAGFEINTDGGHDMLDDNYVIDKDDIKDNYLPLDMYDANFYPCDFWNITQKAKNNVISQLGNYESIQKARQKGVNIAIDGKIVLKSKR